MKRICKASVLFILLFSLNKSQAQVHFTDLKPKLFGLLADKVNFPKKELEKVFATTEGALIQLTLSDNVVFKGTVMSSIQRYNNLYSSLIKLDNLDGTVLGISKRINDDKSVSYIGRIINQKYEDGYELTADATGNYFIKKIKLEDLIQDR